MERFVYASLVASGRYDEKKVYPEYFSPLDTTDDDVDYGQVAWDKNVAFEAPGEDEMAILMRMMQDNSVTVSGASFADSSADSEVPSALPDSSPVIEQIETDREWV